jgi:hypothetical protein
MGARLEIPGIRCVGAAFGAGQAASHVGQPRSMIVAISQNVPVC